MATTLIGVAPDGRTAEETFADALVSKYIQRYKIKSASTDTQVEVLATTNLPQMWDAFAGDAAATVTRRSVASHDEVRNLWYVDVEWSTEARENDQDQNDDPDAAPEDLSASVRWSYETVMEPLVTDALTGNRIANGAGDPFTNPPLMRPVPISVLTWSRWRPFFGGGAEQQAWMGTVNNQPFAGADSYCVLISGIEADLQRVKGRLLWRVTDVLKFRPSSWRLVVPNIGKVYLDGTTRKRFSDDRDNPVGYGFLTATGASSGGRPTTTYPINQFKAKNFALRYPGA